MGSEGGKFESEIRQKAFAFGKFTAGGLKKMNGALLEVKHLGTRQKLTAAPSHSEAL